MRKPAPNELYCLIALIRLTRRADRHHLARQQEISIGLVFGATDAATELVKIGEPEPVGAINDNRIRIRNIEAALDDGCADENVDLAGDEACHYGFEFIRVHLSVTKFDPRLRTKLRDAIAHPFDRLHAIVQEENLALAFKLPIDRIANDALIVTADHCLDGKPIERRRLNRGHVFHSDQRQIERTRDRSGGEREHVDQFEQLLEFLLVQNTETLLFVDHHQTKILKDHVAGDEAMRADDDIHSAVAQQFQNLALLSV